MCGWQKRDDSPEPPCGKFRRLAPFLAAALLALAFLTFPDAPPDNDVDSSLGEVLSYAHLHNLQFGSDLVLTYGPLGHVMFFYSLPHTIGIRMAVDIALCLLVAAGLCLVAWRMRPLWRWILLLLFFWMMPNVPTRADLVIYVGLCCWGILCFVESGPRLPIYALAFTLLTVFGALAKISFLFVGVAGLALVISDLAFRGRGRLAAGMAGSFLAVFLFGWINSGQKPAHLGAYVSNGLAVVQAYNGALGWEGPEPVRARALFLAPLIFCVILLRSLFAFAADEKRRGWRRGVLLAWTILGSFSVWKYGCVRNGREMVLFTFVSVLVLGVGALPCERRTVRGWAWALGLVACVVAAITMQQFFFLSWPDSLHEPFRAIARNTARLLNPGDYQREMEEIVARNRRAAQLPRSREAIGSATTDVFGQCQAFALLDNLNYHPRPIFQSYVACSRPLMELNQRFYESTNAPEYVLFRLSVLDRKFPPMEDGFVLRNLLQNYQPILTEGSFVLLKRFAGKPFASSLAREGKVHLDEAIDLHAFGDADLWLEISLEPTLLGRLREFLYRPPTVRLAAWEAAGGKLMVRTHAPAPMLATGFLASPLLLDNHDVLNLYTGREIKRPGAYSVEMPLSEHWCWKDEVHYRIYKVESRLVRCVPAELASALYPAPSEGQAVSSSTTSNFRLFRPARWRPGMPRPGGWEENLTFAVIFVTPFILLGLLMMFFRSLKKSGGSSAWGKLVVGNALVLFFLLSASLLAGETYYRFFYDTTDSLAFTKTTERWVQRHWRVNNAGCRDDVDYSPIIPPGKRRVTFVGDSFTAGHGIKDVNNRFANLLRAAHPEWDVQVLAAVGLDTGGEQELMERTFSKGCQADEVVLVYCLNDIGDLLPAESDLNGKILAQLDNSGWLVRDSYAINLWYFHYQASRIPYLKDYCAFLRSAYDSAYWDRQKDRLKAFRDLVESHGGHLAVVTFPFLHALGPNYEYQSIHDKLNQCWRDLNVPELDLLSVFKDVPSNRVTVNPYDAHPNEYASKLAAGTMDPWLKKLLSETKPSITNGVTAYGRGGTNSSAW